MFNFITKTWDKITGKKAHSCFVENMLRQEQLKQEAFDEMMKWKELNKPKPGQKWKVREKALVARLDPFQPGYDSFRVEILETKKGWVKFLPNYAEADALTERIDVFIIVYEKAE